MFPAHKTKKIIQFMDDLQQIIKKRLISPKISINCGTSNLRPMKNYLKIVCLLLFLLFTGGESLMAQGGLLKKIKARAEDEIVDDIFGKKKTGETGSSGQSSVQQSNSDASPANTRGGGLTQTAPNVPVNISDAGSAFNSGDYRDARYAVRQAILGIEMEIGQNILDDLPTSVKGLSMVPEEDQVASMSIGFVGLTIERVYREGDQQFKVTLGNNAALLSAVNMYMSSAVYASNEEPDHKQVKFKGYTGILEYDEYSGYKLSVPFGQSSIFVAGGINFESEQEIMAAANEFDLENIKQELGEK